MMQLLNIKALPHPAGNRVDLHWLVPEPGQVDGVRVMRRESTFPLSPHPLSPAEGVIVDDIPHQKLFTLYAGAMGGDIAGDLDNRTLGPEFAASFFSHQVTLSANPVVTVIRPGGQWQIESGDHIYTIVENRSLLEVYAAHSLADRGIRAETVYYYTFFPYRGEPREYIYHCENRVSAMATGPYDFAGQLYRMLPTIYHRYDTLLPPEKSREKMSEEDMKRGQLRRFLDLPGMQLDQIYSFAAASLNLHDIDRVDGKLLPLLAQWIGWQTDYTLEIEKQRSELKNAPALYETIGIIPSLEAVIAKCIVGWKGRPKEFVYNVFLSNHPAKLNLRTCKPDSSGQWVESEEVFSLDFAFEGRPSAARDENGTLLLFYHTRRNGRWEIWYKTFRENQEWTPSQPLFSHNTGTIHKHPHAVLRDKTLRVFWNAYYEEDQTWRILYRERTEGEWSEIKTFDHGTGSNGSQRRSPQAVVDHKNRLWLFWMEKTGNRWQLKYSRYQDTGWESPVDFPDSDKGEDPRVEKDLFVLFHTADTIYSIWVFWARKELLPGGGRGCWEIAFRKKTGVESIEKGWGNIKTVSKDSSGFPYDDCEPAAIVNNGVIELFRASNCPGSWAICPAKYNNQTYQFDIGQRLMESPYSQRAPLPLMIDNSISLVFRSNKSISYQSDLYRATQTTDFRRAGCTAIDTRNKPANSLLGKYEDFQTYTYDTGENGIPSNDNWYARDTIGFYLTPLADEQQLIIKKQEVIKDILKRFLPIQTRVIFIINPPIYKELIPEIDEWFEDRLADIVTEEYPGVSEKFEDKVPGWISFYSWSKEFPAHHTVDFDASPIDTSYRTLHIGLRQFEGQHNICIPPDEYPGANDTHEDKVPEWTWLRSWSEQSSPHHTVDVNASTVDTTSRTIHTGLKGNIKEEKK